MASEQERSTETTAPPHKPSLLDQVKGKVSGVKEKFTTHEPATHAPPETHTTKAESPKGEGFLKKMKDKLPGSQPKSDAVGGEKNLEVKEGEAHGVTEKDSLKD